HISPFRHEDVGKPLPDPAEHNKNLRLYRDALRKVAGQRGNFFVDLYDGLGAKTKTNTPTLLTDNGIHLTAYGYWWAGTALESALGLTPLRWQHEIEHDRKARGDAFNITGETLPPPP